MAERTLEENPHDLYDPKNLTSSLQELEGINIYFSHISNWCFQQWHEGILHN
jgi:hypothetical protein